MISKKHFGMLFMVIDPHVFGRIETDTAKVIYYNIFKIMDKVLDGIFDGINIDRNVLNKSNKIKGSIKQTLKWMELKLFE